MAYVVNMVLGPKKWVPYNREFVLTEFVVTEFD